MAKKGGMVGEGLLDSGPHIRGRKIQEIASCGSGPGDTAEHRACYRIPFEAHADNTSEPDASLLPCAIGDTPAQLGSSYFQETRRDNVCRQSLFASVVPEPSCRCIQPRASGNHDNVPILNLGLAEDSVRGPGAAGAQGETHHMKRPLEQSRQQFGGVSRGCHWHRMGGWSQVGLASEVAPAEA